MINRAFQGTRNDDTILPDITGGIRWIARVASIVLVVLVIADFLYAGNELKLSQLKVNDLVMTISLFGAFTGLIVGLFAEGIGGILTLVGLLVFSVVNHYSGGDFALHLWVLGIPAVLYIIYWLRTS